tara:strand:+ start:284 stop:922 length:639 start_codon:yes stop_codon:yes gene_type:complete
MIKIEKVSKIYKSRELSRVIFDEICLEIKNGDFYKLVGPNGSGKTTLLKLIRKIILPDTGKIILNNAVSLDEISLVSQNYRSFFLNLTVLDNLVFFSSLQDKKINNFRGSIDFYLSSLDLIDKKNDYVSTLSSGEIKKLSIIRGLLSKPKILLLDEVTTSLDAETKVKIIDFICKQNLEKNISVIWATHNPDEIKKDGAITLEIKEKKITKY